jgi:glycosyltransferase involved in cell wall biosynthesis
LLIVGDGPQYEEWYKLSSQIDNNRIKFFRSRKDIPDLLNIFDIFTLVSTTEGTSITVLEAMASELPVIVSDVGGNRDIVKHNQTGYLFKCNDTNQFNIIIEKILTNRNEMKKIGESARASIEQNYNINNFVKKYESVYKK